MTQRARTYMGRKKSLLLLLSLLWLLTSGARSSIAVTLQSKLDQKIQAGLTALQTGYWKQAQSYFEEAVKIFEGRPAPSSLLLSKLSLLKSDTVITVNGKPKDVSGEVNSFRQVMATRQALYEFSAFSAQLAGDDRTAGSYLDKIDEMRGAMWGRSWAELVPQIHTLFYSYLRPDNGEAFGKYLLMAGRLLLSVDEAGGVKLIQEAKQKLPGNAAAPALLASYMIIHNDPSNAATEARASLALNPSQPSVLIDLATAEWLLNQLENASKDARKAAEFDAVSPGPHAALAFVALETGDTSSALKEAELGDKLSNGHRFYRTILAVCLEASGATQQAEKMMAEAWGSDTPDEEQLKAWFFRGKALEYARKLMKRKG